jgi:hypothetical protein
MSQTTALLVKKTDMDQQRDQTMQKRKRTNWKETSLLGERKEHWRLCSGLFQQN